MAALVGYTAADNPSAEPVPFDIALDSRLCRE